MTLVHLKKKEVARSQVRGVDIEFDNFRLASILGVPGHNGICEYIKDVWEESKMCKVPRFAKRDTTSYMDLIYMDHIVSRRLVNLPRVMIRHMSYVVSVKDHELPYGYWMTMIFEAFGVPLVDKQGEKPKRYDYFEETFLSMCHLKRENGVWWLGSGENRRGDDDVQEVESGSGEKFFDAEDEVRGSEEVSEDVSDMPAPAPVQQKEKAPARVDPSAPTGSIPDPTMSKLQVEFERARANRIQADLEKAQAENARLLAILQQAHHSPNHRMSHHFS
ncbi:hypothetical protein Dimus_003641 [Dionaea muscipula]